MKIPNKKILVIFITALAASFVAVWIFNPFWTTEQADELETIYSGWTYFSETQTPVTHFSLERRGGSFQELTPKEFLTLIGKSTGESVEEMDFEGFFSVAARHEDWHGEAERRSAEKFGNFKKYLDEKFRQRKIYKIGKIETSIYIFGVDENGDLSGISFMSVET